MLLMLAAAVLGETVTVVRAVSADSGLAGSQAETEKPSGLRIMPYQEVLVGPVEIDDSAGENESFGTADLDMLYQYILDKEAEWKEAVAQQLEENGIPRDQQYFVYGKDYQDASRQILAMTAVFRGYTFYNRVVCQWYADHLWNETYTYQIMDAASQQPISDLLLNAAGTAADWLGTGGSSLIPAVEGLEENLSGQYKTVVILNTRVREEIYDTDDFSASIPIVWEGWTEEKRSECEALLVMDDDTFKQELLNRQQASLLDSPVPFYKQGAAEWGSQAFGGGTLASDACCPASIAMVLSYFKNTRITPAEVAARYDNDLYRSREAGSYGAKMCAAAAIDYGLQAETGTEALSADKIQQALSVGGKIVMSMRPNDGGGRYATVYHYVVLAGLTEDGRVIVNNPGINTDITYDDMAVILNNQSGRGYGIFYGS